MGRVSRRMAAAVRRAPSPAVAREAVAVYLNKKIDRRRDAGTNAQRVRQKFEAALPHMGPHADAASSVLDAFMRAPLHKVSSSDLRLISMMDVETGARLEALVDRYVQKKIDTSRTLADELRNLDNWADFVSKRVVCHKDDVVRCFRLTVTPGIIDAWKTELNNIQRERERMIMLAAFVAAAA